MKTTCQTSAAKGLKKTSCVIQIIALGVLAILFLVSGPVYAGPVAKNHKHKKNRSHRMHRAFSGGPSVSYATPQTYTAGKTISPLVPASANINSFFYGDMPKANVSFFNLQTPIIGLDFTKDAAGNYYLIQNTEVDKVDTAGNVQTLATGFQGLAGIARDASGNLFVTDLTGNQVYEIAARTNTKTTVGSGFNGPYGIVFDPSGNMYVAETHNNDIKKIQAGTHAITVFATGFSTPAGMAYDATTNSIFVCDYGNQEIKKVRFDGGTTSVYWVDSFGGSFPLRVSVDNSGTIFFIASGSLDFFYKFPGGNTTNEDGEFTPPNGDAYNAVLPDGKGDLYVLPNYEASEIQIITPFGGYFVDKRLPAGLNFDPNAGSISGLPQVASPSTNYTVTAYHTADSLNAVPVAASAIVNITVNQPAAPAVSYTTQSYAINAPVTSPNAAPISTGGIVGDFSYRATASVIGQGFSLPNGVAKDAAGNIYVADRGNNLVKKIAPGGTITAIGSGFSKPTGVAVDAAGNVYVADNGNNAVKKIPAGGGSTVLWGTGFSTPLGIAVDAAGTVYVADKGHSAVKKISTSGVTTTVATGFNAPSAVAVDAVGDIYVAETGTDAIELIPAGSSSYHIVAAGIGGPFGVAIDAAGILYVVGQSDHAVYTINPSSLVPHPIGSEFNSPEGIMIDNAGNVYIADTGNNEIRELQPLGGYFLSKPLPAGLAFNESTGVISGTPTTLTASSPYTVTAWNPAGSIAANFNVQVIANALLSNLAISSGTLSPSFDYNTISYSVSEPNSVTSVTVTPTVFAETSTVKVNNVAVSSGTASVAIPLAAGSNAISTVVTAGDGTTTQTYSTVVTRAPSVIATLSSLAVSAGTLSPVFSTGTNTYTETVANTTSTIKITPTATDTTATITVNGTAVVSGTASGAIALAIGKNVITTVVTAQDGTTVQSYTINITRISNIATLSGLATIPATTLSPVSGPGFKNYVTTVANAISSIQVRAVLTDTTARIKVNGVAVASGTASQSIPLTAGDNTITVLVTAQDGVTSKSYIITVTRQPSSEAHLANLALSNGTLTPAFATSTISYSASVANAISSITVTPIAADATATITVNGTAVASGAASGALTLNVGANAISTVVTAQDGSTTKTYTLTVTRAASANDNLSALKLSVGTLSPVFAAATTSYTASVSNATASVTVTPTTADGNASVKINGTTVASGTASAAIALSVGQNVISVAVTAQDGTTTKTYTITVTRAASINASLASMNPNLTPLSPTFTPATTSYTLSVANTVASMTVRPVSSDANATIKVNGTPNASGTTSAPIALAVGSNTINVVVTAQDGITIKTYTVTVTRAAGVNVTLSNLALSAGTLSPAFASATTSYTASVPNSTATITVTPATTDANATIKVNGTVTASGTASAPIALAVGANNISIVAQDGEASKTYTVTVTRVPSANANLAAMNPSVTPLSPTFAPATTSYTLSVKNTVSSMTVKPVSSDANATIAVNGTAVASGTVSLPIALAVGSNVISVVVTAQDGTTTKTYTINATRASGGADSFDPGMIVTKPTGVGVQNFEPLTSGDGIQVHEGVSPNGDGINDVLQIDNIGRHPDNTLTIMNRNGQLIYEAKGYDNSTKVFDGHSSKNGQMQLPGTYFYSLDYTDQGIRKHKTGFIVLKY